MEKVKPIQLKRVFRVNSGTLKSWGDFSQILYARNMRIPSKASDLLILAGIRKLKDFYPLESQNLLLADVSVEELGLPDQSLYGDILMAGVDREIMGEWGKYKLSKVTPADLMEFRLGYTDQPKNEWLRGAMDGLEHPMGNKMIFRLVHGKDGILYFDTDDGGDLDDPFDDHVRFIWRLVPVTH